MTDFSTHPGRFRKPFTLARTAHVCDLKRMGQALRRRRVLKGISGRTLATALGCSASYLSDVELGRRAISDAHLRTYLKITKP